MTDLGNRREVERRNKELKVAGLESDAALRWLMGDARGRKHAWGILSASGVYRISMGATPEWTAFNEGKRQIGLTLLGDIMRVTPGLYQTMQTENTPQTKTETDDG